MNRSLVAQELQMRNDCQTRRRDPRGGIAPEPMKQFIAGKFRARPLRPDDLVLPGAAASAALPPRLRRCASIAALYFS
jgi:hypothetical protein